MQLTSFLLLALGATTFATPIDISDTSSDDFNGTSASTEHQLEKRGTYGWVTHYRTSDTSCNQGYAGDRPQIRKKCVNLDPVEGGDSIGINWGTWPLAFNSITFYSHAGCIDNTKLDVIPAPQHHNRDGAQTCYASLGKVRSVRSSDTAGDAST